MRKEARLRPMHFQSYTLDEPSVSCGGGNVQCMYGPLWVRFPFFEKRETQNAISVFQEEGNKKLLALCFPCFPSSPPQVYEAIDINLSKTQMIGPRTGLNLSGHETLPSAEEQARQPWLGAPRAEPAAAWVAERSGRADRWFKQQLAEGRASDACLQLEQWGAASVSTPQGVMDSKTQPRADVSADVMK